MRFKPEQVGLPHHIVRDCSRTFDEFIKGRLRVKVGAENLSILAGKKANRCLLHLAPKLLKPECNRLVGGLSELRSRPPPPSIGVPCQTLQLPPILCGNKASGDICTASNLDANGMKSSINISNEFAVHVHTHHIVGPMALNQQQGGSAHVQARGTKQTTYLCGKSAVLAKEPIRSFLSL
jgi:hypothetical protein